MKKRKINVGILFGGRSAEHEVSLQSAKNVIDALDSEKYHPILIGIDKSGKWYLNDRTNFLLSANDPKLIKLNKSGEYVALIPQNEGQVSHLKNEDSNQSVDVVFPILHGPFGEDGTVQGLLKLGSIPFVGASVLGSAVGMDKDVMKRLLRDAKLPISDFITVKIDDDFPDFDMIANRLGVPFFVKPANLGSSVGVNKVVEKTDYEQALTEAFEYDNKILLEEYVDGREIECSVLGNNEPIASVPGEVIPTHEFYSYEAKYIDEKGAALEIPAQLSTEITEKIQEMAITTFKVLACEGLGRIDFFLRSDDEIVVNEINTIPGFTTISMYPRLWEASGISYPELIDRLIQLAFERFEKEQRLKTTQL
jgi:D-alanine-D-alanine ligase